MVDSSQYLAKTRFQLESAATHRRPEAGASGTKVANWALNMALLAAGGETILDLACGNGRHLEALLQKNSHVFAADISEPMLKAVRACQPDSPVCDRLVRLDAETLPFADNTFSTVVCLRFFHHLPTQKLRTRILGEALRVSRDAVILTWKSVISSEFLIRKSRSLFRRNSRGLSHYYILADELKDIAGEHGWKMTRNFSSHPFAANHAVLLEPQT